MTYRQKNGSVDLIAILQHQEKAQAKKIGINKIKDLIDWESFRNELEEILGYAKREKSKGGRPTFDPVFMFKIVILQKYYGLSDDATEEQIEEQIEDRASFMGFLDLKVGDHIPDAKTIWEFRQRLEANGMNGSQRLFTHFEKISPPKASSDAKAASSMPALSPRLANATPASKMKKSKQENAPKALSKAAPKANKKTAMPAGS